MIRHPAYLNFAADKYFVFEAVYFRFRATHFLKAETTFPAINSYVDTYGNNDADFSSHLIDRTG